MSTVLLRNTNPLGYVDVPVLGRCGPADDDTADQDGVGCLHPGEEFECDEELAASLLEQVGNFELADGDSIAAMTVAQLEEYAAERGIDLTGKTKKAQIVRAIKAAS